MIPKKPFKKGMGPSIAPYYKAAGGGGASFVPGIAIARGTNGFAGPTTFTGMNGGVNYPASIVAVGIIASDASDPLGFTVGTAGGAGITNFIKIIADSNKFAALWYAVVPNGTVDTFTATNAGNGYNKIAMAAGYLTGMGTNAPGTSGVMTIPNNQNDPQTLASALTISSGGFGIAVGGSLTVSGSTVTWGSATQDIVQSSAPMQIMLAHSSTVGSWSPQYSGSSPFSFAGALAAATWS